ncbi:GNAT family N-acetyltransferase [Pseudomonas aegrilactucae]|uniref:GNAT family N-acetyltransferase n=1 Tax=Pseudomonas aegrilactucae TaxID=2854028 RepID=A0A9Q2XM79_9PSED|nr:GNAT family N-acetyltransferase [Pseudomonas aegrilactucae]MBV6288925.1 GNAT family N-acetyltransferase [Pseudomonas aegrilactucae]
MMTVEPFYTERSELNEQNIEEIYRICSDNSDYFAHMRETLSRGKLARLLTALPPGADPNHKKNIGFRQQGRLIGYLELIESFPESDHVLIGFFILDKTMQRGGLGSAIINLVLADYAGCGFNVALLSHASTDPGARAFWLKNQFLPTGEVDACEDIELVVMERKLSARF